MSDLIRIYIHPEEASPERADKAISAFLAEEVSRSRLEESFKLGKVKMDGSPIIKKHKLFAGDKVEIEIPEPLPVEVVPVDIPVEILYEDDDVVVVNKPAGMTVHPGSGTGEDTLVHAMMHHTKGKLSMAAGAMRPGIVHRLDKETSGAMIMAKTDNAYYRLVELFSEREIDKRYLAIVCGVPTIRSGIIRKPIGRHPSFRTKMCVCDEANGRDACTEWYMQEKFGNKASLMSCKIYTGRTHQIRVHLTDMGFPILGDYTYSFQKNKMKEIPAPERVMLHAFKLAMPHPTKEDEFIEVEATPPEDFRNLLDTLKKTYL
ncbi:MAG: RluA family pseudouridine synthase [Verrucomicrobiaceae bacterium]|nr:RluA family pseudouridine synthase [Verrucomicrobiaceae bacterium]